MMASVILKRAELNAALALLCNGVNFKNSPYALLVCKSPIETSLASPIEVSRSLICERPIEVAWNDGDHDEPQ